MASLARCSRLFLQNLQKRDNISNIVVRNAAYWNKDWKPGPYPRTAAEREAAAKKYGLRPEDYAPYPDDGLGYGDYPRLPRVSAESRDVYENYDIPELKKNWGEPLHVDYDAMTEDKWDPTTRQRISTRTQITWLGTVLTVAIGAYLLANPYPHFHPVMPKQYPHQGTTHYTFEKPDQ